MPIAMCRANVAKNAFVLKNIDKILDGLTRGLDLNILARGYGDEGRGVTVSYQAQTDVLGAVLPSNSPGVHTLWLPVIALQIGLAAEARFARAVDAVSRRGRDDRGGHSGRSDFDLSRRRRRTLAARCWRVAGGA